MIICNKSHIVARVFMKGPCHMAGTGSIQHLSRLLDLFGDDRWLVTIEQVMTELELPRSTAYRTVSALAGAGFLDRVSDEGYSLGPRILQLYRQLQLGDPLLQVARPVCAALAAIAPQGSAVILCRSYFDGVMCVHQERTPGPQEIVSYQIGRPMPLYHGSSSKTVLAVLERPRLLKLYTRDANQIRKAGFGGDREAFLANVKAIQRAGYYVAHGEVDRGRVGISSPFAVKRFGLTGCISIVLSEAAATEENVSRAIIQVSTAAHDTTRRLDAWKPERATVDGEPRSAGRRRSS
ncbi:IclR family transcriptional regulator C-terminal domain-containing protein [Bradyrhizobium sp. dw_411]|uniref:IclR family transcriptional regulator n=1 Tax=Bradyrhizobium sp. dw_411 TaxID=2720082 RepID=UPI001BCE31ED|nr:IclR family transcriptional regulator C-terminal domain-containing protein [Bradyrhizobium sp. dw_411]